MKRFRFPLETARRWRERQTEVEEAHLQELLTRRRALDDRAASIQAELRAEHRRIEDRSYDAGELARLDDFRRWVSQEKQRLRAAAAECDRRIETQRATLMEARRRFQLVDKLREKAMLTWSRASNKEEEDLAAELYLARLSRRSEDV